MVPRGMSSVAAGAVLVNIHDVSKQVLRLCPKCSSLQLLYAVSKEHKLDEAITFFLILWLMPGAT